MAMAISDLAASPLAQRYRFDVIVTYGDARPLQRLLTFARSLARLARWCMGGGTRIVHVHMAARGSMYRKAAVVLLAKALRKPVILHIHAGAGDLEEFLDRIGGLQRAALRRAFASADVVVAVSARSVEVLRREVIPREIPVVPNAPPPLAPPRPPRQGGAVRVLYLGGFANPVKGGAVLLEALPSLLNGAGGGDGLEVVLAGPGEPPAEGLPAGAEWRGWLDPEAKREAFDAADVFVMPSLSEGMPIALLEAMANRLPVVATRVGGIPDLLEAGVDAMLVEPGRAEDLAAALARLAADPGLREELAAAAAARLSALADEDVYGQLAGIYDRLAERS